jgi:hypothetical protein
MTTDAGAWTSTQFGLILTAQVLTTTATVIGALCALERRRARRP